MEMHISAGNIEFKVQDHRTDPAKLVIKSTHPEIGALLALSAGVEVQAAQKGSVYHQTFVDKASFGGAMSKVLLDVIEGNIQVSPPVAESDEGPDEDEDAEDDSDDEEDEVEYEDED